MLLLSLAYSVNEKKINIREITAEGEPHLQRLRAYQARSFTLCLLLGQLGASSYFSCPNKLNVPVQYT